MSTFTFHAGWPLLPDGLWITVKCDGHQALHYLYTLFRLIRTAWGEKQR